MGQARVDDEDETIDSPEQEEQEQEAGESPAEEAPESPAEEAAVDEEAEASPAEKSADVTSAAPNPAADKQQVMKDYLSKKYNTAADTEKLQNARKWANIGEGISNIGRAASQYATARATAMGRFKQDNGFWDNMSKQAQQPVLSAEQDRAAKIHDFLQENQLGRQSDQDAQKNALAKQTLDQADPDSREAQVARSAFKANFPDVADAMGDDFEKMTPKDLGRIGQMTDTKAKIDSAKEIAKTRAQAHTDAVASRNETANARLDDKKSRDSDKQLDKDEKELGLALDPNKARAGLAGDSQKRLNAADRGNALIYETNPDGSVQKDQNGKPIIKNLNPTLMGEAAQSWASMIGTGNGSQADAAVVRLVPHTAGGKIASVKEWITGEPQGADQQAFLKQMGDSIERERRVSENLLKQAQVQSAARFAKLKGERPEAWDRQLIAAGVDPKDIDQNGRHNPGWNKKKAEATASAPPSAQAPVGLPPISAIDAEIARRKAANGPQTAGAQ